MRTLEDIIAEIEADWHGPWRTRLQSKIDAMKGKTFEYAAKEMEEFLKWARYYWRGDKSYEIRKELTWWVKSAERREFDRLIQKQNDVRTSETLRRAAQKIRDYENHRKKNDSEEDDS